MAVWGEIPCIAASCGWQGKQRRMETMNQTQSVHNYNGNMYRITIMDMGFIAIDRENEDGTLSTVWYCQGEEADEYLDLMDKWGNVWLIQTLDYAGVEL